MTHEKCLELLQGMKDDEWIQSSPNTYKLVQEAIRIQKRHLDVDICSPKKIPRGTKYEIDVMEDLLHECERNELESKHVVVERIERKIEQWAERIERQDELLECL